MSLTLPSAIRVQVQASASETGAGLRDLLVALNIAWHGQYYFGALLGLTDDHGVVTATGEDIARCFAEDQRLFPMDYKVALHDCDPIAAVVITGGAEFLTHRAGLDPGWVSAEARAMWGRAVNGLFRSERVSVSLVDPAPLVVSLTINRIEARRDVR